MRLSAQSLRILAALHRHQSRNGYPPTVEELRAEVGLASKSTVHEHLCRLAAAGAVTWRPHSPRTMVLTTLGLSTLSERRAA